MKMPEPPTITPNVFGEYVVRWEIFNKAGNRYEKSGMITYSKETAMKLLNHHNCLRVLYPLKSYAKQQEHIISVMMLGNGQRAKPMGKLHKLVSGLLSEPNQLPDELAEKLQHNLLPLLQESQPGINSKYHPVYTELGQMVCDFIRANRRADALTEKIPHL